MQIDVPGEPRRSVDLRPKTPENRPENRGPSCPLQQTQQTLADLGPRARAPSLSLGCRCPERRLERPEPDTWLQIIIFAKGRELVILGVWGAPGAPETLQKGGGEAPAPSEMAPEAPGAAQTPKMTDLRQLNYPSKAP